jgi:UPF0716 protein FxsA
MSTAVFFRLLLLFTLVPIAELWLLLVISDKTSWQFTVLLVLVTGIVGASLARWQGWQTLAKIQQQAARGESPAGGLLDGMMILIAGTLLITPGILTDVVGFTLLFPPARQLLKHRLYAWIKAHMVVQHSSAQFPPNQFTGEENRANSAQPDGVIDAEFTRETLPPDDPQPR